MANKKLFEDLVLTSTPLTTDRFALGKSGSAYKNITAADLKTWITSSIPAPYVPEFITKVVNIGAYDMQGSGERTKEINLGVTRNKIRSVVVMIQSNDGGFYPIFQPDQSGNVDEVQQYWFVRQESQYASNARIKIASKNNGYFDQSAFNGNGPSGNRGYITIIHVP